MGNLIDLPERVNNCWHEFVIFFTNNQKSHIFISPAVLRGVANGCSELHPLDTGNRPSERALASGTSTNVQWTQIRLVRLA